MAQCVEHLGRALTGPLTTLHALEGDIQYGSIRPPMVDYGQKQLEEESICLTCIAHSQSEEIHDGNVRWDPGGQNRSRLSITYYVK